MTNYGYIPPEQWQDGAMERLAEALRAMAAPAPIPFEDVAKAMDKLKQGEYRTQHQLPIEPPVPFTGAHRQTQDGTDGQMNNKINELCEGAGFTWRAL